MRLELRRQAADRELGRLRLLAGTALVGWIASVVALGARIGAVATPGARRAGRRLGVSCSAPWAPRSPRRDVSGADVPQSERSLDAGPAGSAALWLLIAGLGAIAVSLLL